MYRTKYLPEVEADVKALDGSQRKDTLKAMLKLQERPEEYGQPLGHKHGLNLTGLRRAKLRKQGIRIVYRVFTECETVLILAVGKREDDRVYREVQRRYCKV